MLIKLNCIKINFYFIFRGCIQPPKYKIKIEGKNQKKNMIFFILCRQFLFLPSIIYNNINININIII